MRRSFDSSSTRQRLSSTALAAAGLALPSSDFQGGQFHTQGREYLAGAVVQFASDAPSFFVLHVQQLA